MDMSTALYFNFQRHFFAFAAATGAAVQSIQ